MRITGSPGEIARQLTAYSDSLEQKALDVAEKIAVNIAAISANLFNNAVVNVQPNGTFERANVQVSVLRGKAMWVIAQGEDAVFVEFGAGVYYNGAAGSSPVPEGFSPLSGGQKLGLTIGSYGNHNGTKNTWAYYDGERTVVTRGTPAAMPMYRATKQVMQSLYDIARGVFE